MSLILSGTDGLSDVDGSAATPAIRGTDANTGIFFPAADTIAFAEGGAESMRIDSSGNLGLGVTPSAWSWRALQVGSFGGFFATNSAAYASYLGNNAYYDGSNWRYIASSGAVHYELAGGDRAHKWYNAASGTAGNTITFTQAMTLDASGNLLVGTTNTAPGSGNTTTGCALNGALGIGYFSRASDSSLIINTNANGKVSRIYRSGSEVGDITVTTTTTSFNSTSDYRLKTVIGSVTGQGERIDALEPIEYTWNSNGLRTRGFLAHKFQEVYANSVTGTKDGIDANGKPEYQSMQASTSEVIADLVAEIQSLRKRLAAAGI